jgi:hypothetical protein
MKGFEDDPHKIKQNLVPGFYKSKQEFNQSFYEKLNEIYSSVGKNDLRDRNTEYVSIKFSSINFSSRNLCEIMLNPSISADSVLG